MYMPRYQSLNGSNTGLLKLFIIIFIHRFLRVCIEYKNSIYRVSHVEQNVKISLLISKIGKSVGEGSYIVQGDCWRFFQGLLEISDDLAKDFEKSVDQFFSTTVFVSSDDYNFPVRHSSLSSTLTEIFSCLVSHNSPCIYVRSKRMKLLSKQMSNFPWRWNTFEKSAEVACFVAC